MRLSSSLAPSSESAAAVCVAVGLISLYSAHCFSLTAKSYLLSCRHIKASAPDVRVCSLSGGDKRNAIAREAQADLVCITGGLALTAWIADQLIDRCLSCIALLQPTLKLSATAWLSLKCACLFHLHFTTDRA